MRYLIDGYNLIFRLGLSRASFTKHRDLLIDSIRRKAEALKLQCILIFDAAYSPGESTRSYLDPLEIVFTSKGQSADDWILEEIKGYKAPEEVMLITSDKKLAWQARQYRIKISSIEEFMTTLDRRYKNLSKPQATPKEFSQINVVSEPAGKIAQIAIPEGSIEYYEQAFEKRLKDLPAQKPPKATHGKQRKNKNAPAPERDEGSEFDRWLRIFEKK